MLTNVPLCPDAANTAFAEPAGPRRPNAGGAPRHRSGTGHPSGMGRPQALVDAASSRVRCMSRIILESAAPVERLIETRDERESAIPASHQLPDRPRYTGSIRAVGRRLPLISRRSAGKSRCGTGSKSHRSHATAACTDRQAALQEMPRGPHDVQRPAAGPDVASEPTPGDSGAHTRACRAGAGRTSCPVRRGSGQVTCRHVMAQASCSLSCAV